MHEHSEELCGRLHVYKFVSLHVESVPRYYLLSHCCDQNLMIRYDSRFYV